MPAGLAWKAVYNPDADIGAGEIPFKNYGASAGLLGNVWFIDWRLEYRYYTGVFKPAFYNGGYEASRSQYVSDVIDYLANMSDPRFNALTMGIYGEGGFTLNKICSLDLGYFWPWDASGTIAPEDMQRIFEPFYTKKVMGRSGTGLGMAVVWGTVQDHKGHIQVESREGLGSTFTLLFPATREALRAKTGPLPLETFMGRGEAILVVDDVPEQREIAATILGRLNYRVATAGTCAEAVEFARRNPPDLVVLDMIMEPGPDGLETYRRILQIQPRQRAIIASGYSETDRVREAQRLGAGTYVRKPYLMEKLGLAVRQELDRPSAAGA